MDITLRLWLRFVGCLVGCHVHVLSVKLLEHLHVIQQVVWRVTILNLLSLIASLALAVNLQYQDTATYYHPSLTGNNLGCTQPHGGKYWPWDDSIAAIGPSNYANYPCGTRIIVHGPAGSHIVTRRDSCPGCGHNHIDLSEAAIQLVCGGTYSCKVSFYPTY